MKTITRYAAVRKNVQHFLIKGNMPGYNMRSQSCAYLTPDGARCAIGILPPKKAVQEFVSTYKHSIAACKPSQFLWACGIEIEPVDTPVSFARELQRCHDDAADRATENHINERAMLRMFRKIYAKNLRRLCAEWGIDVERAMRGVEI